MGLYPGGGGLYSGWKICFRFDGLITGGAYNRGGLCNESMVDSC